MKFAVYLLAITFCVGVKTTEAQTIPCDTTRCQGFELFPIGQLNGTEIDCWSNVRTSNPEWVISGTSTSSGSTGPNFPGNGNRYIFLETSFPAETGQSDTLTSPFIDISNLTNPELSFLYHMFGATVGTLKFEASDDNGASWTELGSIVGQQQTSSNESWRRQTEVLSNFNSPIAIRFIGIRGNNFTSDIALDDICVEEAQSCPRVLQLMAQISLDTVRLDWEAGSDESQWLVSFSQKGAGTSQSIVHISNEPFFETILENFPIGSIIDATVRAVCGPGDTSAIQTISFILTNQKLIKEGNGDTQPSVAFNTTDSTFLVVWANTDDPSLNYEYEIFGQLFTSSGAAIADKFRISDMGPLTNDVNFDAFHPHVVYNPQKNNYLVVWDGDNDTFNRVNDEFEIYGQLLDAAGNEIGTNDFLISNTGPDGNPDFDAIRPRVAYNTMHNNYFVVWKASDTTGNLVADEFEIYGKLIDAQGNALQADEVRLSEMDIDGNPDIDAVGVDIAYNETNNEYVAVWISEESVMQIDDMLVPNQAAFALIMNDPAGEVYGQRISAQGVPFGSDDFIISDMTSIGGFAGACAIAHNSDKNEYLVSWQGEIGNDSSQVFGQLLTSAGTETGPDDFAISDIHSSRVAQREYLPEVTYNPINMHYLVTWAGDSDESFFELNDVEIFGQRISMAGDEIGVNDFQITNVDDQRSTLPEVALNMFENNYITVFEASNGIGLSINSFCQDEIDDFTLGMPILNDYFLAGKSISSASFVSNGGDVTFDVSGIVNLFPEFRVETNAQFEVLLNGCGL